MDGYVYPTKWAGRDYRVGEQERVGEMGVAQTKSGNERMGNEIAK